MGQMVKFELIKIFQKKIVLVGLAAILFMNVTLFFAWGSPSISLFTKDGTNLKGMDAVQYDRQIAQQYQGPLTDEKVRQIIQEAPDLDKRNAVYFTDSLTSSILQNFTSSSEETKALEWNGLTVEKAFPPEMGEIKVGYTRGWVNTIYYISILFLLLGYLIAVAIAPVFSDEYTRGTDALILSSHYGKNRCPSAKIIASLLFSLILSVFLIVVNLLLFAVTFGVSGWDASVQLNDFGIFKPLMPLTCLQTMGYSILCWLSSAICFTMMVLVLSVLCRSSFISLTAAAVLFTVPMMIQPRSLILQMLLGLMPSVEVRPYNIMNLSSGPLAFPWFVFLFMIVVSIASWFGSRRMFARHQVT